MLEFVGAAVRNIPGVAGCEFRRTTESEEQARPATSGCEPYVIRMRTIRKSYGEVVLCLDDREAFSRYETALHNFSNSIALRLENLEYQTELERQVEEKTRELNRSLHEKELLLREIHHRVKNNFGMVVSLLRLQFAGHSNPAVQDSVNASIDRIQSMALVHQFLYQSDSQSSIDFHGFVERVIEKLSQTYAAGRSVRFMVSIADTPVDIRVAAPVSLIVNELVTNSLKYAFPDGRAGTITITTREADDDTVELVVADDGVGLPPDFDVHTSQSLGMQLIQGLTDQIRGELAWTRAPGTRFTIRFPQSAETASAS
jgi:two-component system, sensor histidine kinase PdtaS